MTFYSCQTDASNISSCNGAEALAWYSALSVTAQLQFMFDVFSLALNCSARASSCAGMLGSKLQITKKPQWWQGSYI